MLKTERVTDLVRCRVADCACVLIKKNEAGKVARVREGIAQRDPADIGVPGIFAKDAADTVSGIGRAGSFQIFQSRKFCRDVNGKPGVVFRDDLPDLIDHPEFFRGKCGILINAEDGRDDQVLARLRIPSGPSRQMSGEVEVDR